MVIFKKLKWKNVLSYGNKLQELDLNNNQTNLITGQNGEGKSAVISAFFFCLIGKTYTGLKKKELVNNINQKNLYTELEFKVKNVDYKIERGISPDLFRIYKKVGENYELIEIDASLKNYQEYIENITKLNENNIRQTIILSAEFYTPYLKLTNPEKKNFIDYIFSLDLFTQIKELIKNDINNYKSSITNLNNTIESLNKTLEYIETIKNENNEEQKKKLDSIKNEIQKLKQQVKSYTEKIDELSIEVQELSDKQRKIYKITNSKKFKKVFDDLLLFDEKIKDIEKNKKWYETNNKCDKCQQEISTEHKKTIYETLDNEKDNVQKNILDLNKKKEKFNLLLKEQYNLQKKISGLNQDIMKKESESSKIEHQIQLLRKQFNQETHGKQNKDVDKINSLLNNKDMTLKEKNDFINTKRYYDIIFDMLHNSDNGLRVFLLKDYLLLLNKFIDTYLDIFDAKFQVKFVNEYDVNIIDSEGRILTYKALSTGQKKRLDFSILFSFVEIAKIKNNIFCNVLWLDEVLSNNLDENGVSGLINLLQNLKSKKYTVYAITHNDKIKNLFNNIFEVTKKTFSRIKKR